MHATNAPANQDGFTADLPTWAEVSAETEWSGIIVGNGASRAIWDGFGYQSLFATAQSDIEHPIDGTDVALFDVFGVENFESILAALSATKKIDAALNRDSDEVERAYSNIRQALIEAVHAIHVSWADLPPATLLAVRAEMLRYKYVFTTNYDLILYWAVMAGDLSEIRDFFWTTGGVFDPLDTEVWNKCSLLLFLHGGLHLLRLEDGRVCKRTAAGATLLDSFGNPQGDHPDATPLIITEGTSEEKLAAIRTSEYLSFALNQLRSHKGNLVVFGHSLGPGDEHIAAAVAGLADAKIAISIRSDHTAEEVISRKAGYQQALALPRERLTFFDAATHPLGDPSMHLGPIDPPPVPW